MCSMLYLARLAGTLRDGLARLPGPFRGKQAAWLADAQRPDGGFGGRRGPSDLYYTGFALRTADLLRLPQPSLWQRASTFLRTTAVPAEVSDALSILMARAVLELHGRTLWCETCALQRVSVVRSTIEAFRSPRGAFSKVRGGPPSLYHTFLGALCLDLLGESVGDAEGLAAHVLSRQSPDGGFGDLSASAATGTNPTAAAVALLRLLGKLAADVCARATAFLLALQRPDGGFAAHRAAPASDLMSTFTALTALADMEALGQARLGDAGRYVQALALPAGGFLAAQDDDAADIEYTYYGLGCLAILSHFAASHAACADHRPGCCP